MERSDPDQHEAGALSSTRQRHHCTACGWEWFGRTVFRPTRCPRCMRFTWDRPRPEDTTARRTQPAAAPSTMGEGSTP
jgi:hypothetical protein